MFGELWSVFLFCNGLFKRVGMSWLDLGVSKYKHSNTGGVGFVTKEYGVKIPEV